MLRQLLKSKLHFARVTEANVDYAGSLSIDEEIMGKANILPHEKLLIANVETGARFETYAIPAPAASKTIGLNGAAAKLGSVGDRLIVMAFGLFLDSEKACPVTLIFGEDNNTIK